MGEEPLFFCDCLSIIGTAAVYDDYLDSTLFEFLFFDAFQAPFNVFLFAVSGYYYRDKWAVG